MKEGKRYIVLLDEMAAEFFESCPDYIAFFEEIYERFPLVNIIMAVNPSGNRMTIPLSIEPSEHISNKVLEMQLLTRHRNSYQVAAFLVHITYMYNDPKLPFLSWLGEALRLKQPESSPQYNCLCPSKDNPIDSSQLPEGDITLWYHRDEDVSEFEILRFIKR